LNSFDDISHILSCRGTTLSTLSQDKRLQTIMGVEAIDTRLVEVNGALLASNIYRSHDALQEALSLATSMTDLIISCNQAGIKADVAIHMEAANALWDQGEMGSSIRMLQALDDARLLKNQTIAVGRSQLLSTIGQRVSFARLEKADHVIARYLEPALTELRGADSGSEAAEVFHQFALFCDQQLQDPDRIEDLERARSLSKHKQEEVNVYETVIKNARSQDKGRHKRDQDKAKKWLKMDLEELQRHMNSREQFLRRCLENYLLALKASDDHDNNALRFSSLWFQHSEDGIANDAVSRHMRQVPSRKFAPLMNQLSSRLQKSDVPKSDDQFQQLLFDLVVRICTEHPYHGMYHIYAGAHTKANASDQSATARSNAAIAVAQSLERSKASRDKWSAIQHSNEAYCRLAGEKDDRYRAPKKFSLKDSVAAIRFNKILGNYKVPPPTMSIELSPTMDYSKVPVMLRLAPMFSIASGVSAPKIITVIGDNGLDYKQLVNLPL
jgi:ataxia telangiectasia mutated family protein